jgi:hypothetical protein
MIKITYNKPDYVLKKGEHVLVASKKHPGTYFSARLTQDIDLQSGEYTFVTADPQIYERDIEVPINRIKKLFRVVDEEKLQQLIDKSLYGYALNGINYRPPHPLARPRNRQLFQDYDAYRRHIAQQNQEADVIHEVVMNEPNLPPELIEQVNNWYYNRVDRPTNNENQQA